MEPEEAFPWRQWMKTGIGGLGWRPVDFWDATLTEFFIAIKGHNEAQGGEEETAGPSQGEMAAIIAKYG
ncbi:phage tail assembly chaperone [Rhizobium leucaenae]|uniref:phage tail assembly chaperone n=1 Tax=Rhizobium leucaenae TaxID=29450 RepID=UPI0024758005|nr:phage tail assembly chaperone [Rhizobium leucaenae]